MTSTAARVGFPLAGLVLGAGAALVLVGVLLGEVDTCPEFESEGPSAAPGSPYTAVMCLATQPFPWSLVIAGGLGLVTAVLAARSSRPLLWSALPLLLPALVVGLLHLTLPRDCLSGRTDRGECARDREMF